MGCTASRPRPTIKSNNHNGDVTLSANPVSALSSNNASTLQQNGQPTTPATVVGTSNIITAALISPSNNARKSQLVTPTGVALDYLRSLASTVSPDTLVCDYFGDHEEFCYKLSQNPSTTHLLQKKADVFISYPSDCTVQRLIQSLSDIHDSPVFIWIDGKSTKTNGVDRSQPYFTALFELYRSIGKGIVVASPWNESSPLPAFRCLEMYYAATCGATVLVAASRKECDEFVREMREHPLGPTRFHEVLDHEVEDTSSTTAISEIIRENFVEVRSCTQSLFRNLVTRLADEMLNGIAEESEQRATASSSRASLHYACGELEESKRQFENALDILLKVRNSPFAASVLHNIAKIYEDQGNIAQAFEIYDRCLTMEEPVSRLSLKISSSDSLVQKSPKNQNQKLETLWRDSFVIPSPHDIGGATTLFNMACLLAQKGENDKAESLFLESLKARQAYAPGGESLDVAWCLNTMGVFYEAIGKKDLALKSYEDALAMRKLCNASETLLTESLDNLGAYLLEEGKNDDSRSLLDESLAIRVKYFGLDSVPVGHSLALIAKWWKSFDLQKSQEIAQQAIVIFSKSNMPQMVEVIQAYFMISHEET
jgi:tetratricopeptide (TPR) repeat protein